MTAAAEAAIRAAGLRATRPRRLVLETLDELGPHQRADDVAAAIAARGERLSRMSVYNALDALGRAGLVDVLEGGGGAARYEVAGPAHHHFVCRGCGAVLDVEPPRREPRWLALDVPGAATVDTAEVLLRGLCSQCAVESDVITPRTAEGSDRRAGVRRREADR